MQRFPPFLPPPHTLYVSSPHRTVVWSFQGQPRRSHSARAIFKTSCFVTFSLSPPWSLMTHGTRCFVDIHDHESLAGAGIDLDFDRAGIDAIHGSGTNLREHARRFLAGTDQRSKA